MVLDLECSRSYAESAELRAALTFYVPTHDSPRWILYVLTGISKTTNAVTNYLPYDPSREKREVLTSKKLRERGRKPQGGRIARDHQGVGADDGCLPEDRRRGYTYCA